MVDERNLKRADSVFNSICKMMDDNNWEYDADSESISILISFQKETLPVDLQISILSDRELVFIISKLPIEVPKKARIDMACAVSILNYAINFGCFEYDINSGIVKFRMTTSYANSIISPNALHDMILTAVTSIEQVNDKLKAIADLEMTAQEFYDFMRK